MGVNEMEPKRVQPDPEAVKLAHKAMDILNICAKSAEEALRVACHPILVVGDGLRDIRVAKTGEILENK
jgi:hypothetical protein